MARFKEINDLYYTDAGDLWLGTDGDLADTHIYHYRGFLQRVLTRIRSKRGEWKQQPTLGADLGRFVGKPNTQDVGQQIREQIVSELVQDDLLRGGELSVDVFPIDQNKIGIALIVNPPRASGQIVLTFTYDMRDNRLISRNV